MDPMIRSGNESCVFKLYPWDKLVDEDYGDVFGGRVRAEHYVDRTVLITPVENKGDFHFSSTIFFF